MIDDQIGQNIFHEIVKRINNNTLQLASLPDIIFKVNAVLADDRKGLVDIAKVIQREIALSTRIIHIANSPALRGSREVTSMSDAINRLGVDLVKNLAICVSLKDKFNTKNLVHKDLMLATIQESMLRSVYGFLIAKYIVKGLIPEMSLIGGLVSKVGHVVILRYLNDTPEYKTMNIEDVKIVINKFGDEVSELILRRWDFPTDVIDATFGRTISNTVAPTTYRDVYMLTSEYIEFMNGGADQESDIFMMINAMVNSHQDEYNSLSSLLG